MVAETREPATPTAKKRKSRWLWLYALVLTIIVTYFVLPQTVGTCIRGHILGKFQEHWSGHTVRLGAVRFEPGVGVLLDDLRIWPKDASWNEAPIVHVQRIVVRTKLNFVKWTESPFESDHLILNGIQCDVHPAADGSWPIAALWPPPSFGKQCPRITVRESFVRVFQSPNSKTVAVELRGAQGQLDKSVEGTKFHATAYTDISGKIVVSGALNASGGMAVVASIDQLRVDPALLRRLPATLAKPTGPIKGLSCIANLALRIEGKPSAGLTNLQTAATIEFLEGRFATDRLVYPLEQLRGKLTVRSTGVEIDRLDATHGNAKLQLAGRIYGLTPESTADLHLIAQNIEVNETLICKFPQKLHIAWPLLHPQGIADFNVKLQRREKWRAYGDIVMKGLDVESAQFPYPVRQATGLVQINGDQLTGRGLTGLVADKRIRCDIDTQMVRGGPLDLRIAVDGPVPIDDTLLSALTQRGEPTSNSERVVRSLSPQGKIQVTHVHLRRDAYGRSSRSIKLQVVDGRVRYQAVPFPIYDVRGQVEIDEYGVRFSEFRGQNNDAATIQLSGSWINALGPNNGRLDLKIDGYGVPLDDGLRSALPPSVRHTWDSLAPGGTLDHLHIQTSYEGGSKPELAITAEQWGSEGRAANIVTLQPTALAYRLDVRRAVVRLNDETVMIEQLDGWHNASHLTTAGHCTRNATGQWVLHLDVLPGSRLVAEPDLLTVLPEGARRALTEINLNGPVGLRGVTDIALPCVAHSDPEIQWDLLLQLEGNELGRDSEVRALRGEVIFTGSRRGEDLRASGQLRVDSMHTHGVQVTGMSGPYELRDGMLFWGRSIEPSTADNRSNPGEPITAKMFDGQVTLDGKLSLAESRFELSANLVDADAAALLSELGQQQAVVRGRCGAVLTKLEGILGECRTVSGTGSAYLREANIYQLPSIISLLAVLSIKPNEDAAFTTGDMQFQIDGDRVVFNSIQLWGDIIALYGVGTVNIRRDLDLTFDTRVSPQNIWSQVVRPVTGQKYNLWSVQVGGTLDNPQIRRAPQVEQALDRLRFDPTKQTGKAENKTVLGSLPILRNLTW